MVIALRLAVLVAAAVWLRFAPPASSDDTIEPSDPIVEEPTDRTDLELVPPPAEPTDPSADAYRQSATQIYDLLQERLDPAIDPLSLFALPSSAAEHLDLHALLTGIVDARAANSHRRRRTFRHPRYPSPEEIADLDPVAAWQSAQIAFLGLPYDERERLLLAHAETRRIQQVERTRLDETRRLLAELVLHELLLRRFLEGRLDPAIDPIPLVTVHLGSGAPSRYDRMLEAWSARSASAAVEESTPEPSPVERGATATQDDLLDEELDEDIEPPTGDRPDAADADGRTEEPTEPPDVASMTVEALRQWASDHAATVSPDDLDAAVEAAQRNLDAATVSYWRLSSAQRARLHELHASNAPSNDPEADAVPSGADAEDEAALEVSERREEAEREADELDRKQQAAEAAADQATTETGRVIAEERARLLGIQVEQARFEIELTNREQDALNEREEVLRGRRALGLRVDAFARGDSQEDPYAVYDGVVEALRDARSELRAALKQLSAPSEVPAAPATDRSTVGETDRDEHRKLRATLDEKEAELRHLENELRWKVAETRRDNVLTMTDGRAALLDALPTEIEYEVTGFGARGRRQVVGELAQLELELRLIVASLPRWARSASAWVQSDPTAALYGAAKLVGVLFVFAFVRRRMDAWLDAVDKHPRGPRKRGRTTRLTSTLLYYLARVHAPLEYVALLTAAGYLFLDPSENATVRKGLEMIAVVLGGLVTIRLIDAVAHRSGPRRRGSEEVSRVRLRSLRLVVGAAVAVLLLLLVVDASVGRGALFRWTVRLSWWLVVPAALLLLFWWRRLIFERLEARAQPGLVVRFLIEHARGPARIPLIPVGALFLIADGVYRLVLRQISRFAVLRRGLAYLLRKQASKAGFVDFGSGQYRPLDPTLYDQIGPSTPSETIDESIAFEEVKAAAYLLAEAPGAFVAVVGPRGAGRSTTVQRIAERVGRDRVLMVQCPTGTLEDLTSAVAAAVGVKSDASSVPDLGECLARSGAEVLAVDGLHRLARPHVGGFHELDRLLEAIRRANVRVSWIATLEATAWQYIRRAWDADAMFDQVIHLSPWDEEAIENLIASRNASAGIEASFEDLEVPQQLLVDVTLTEEERSELAFYRILWDYTDGNPGLAISFWRDSLVSMGSGELSVRLFVAPATTELDGLPAPCYFAMRSVAQLEQATFDEVVACTNLRPSEVANAIRLLTAKGCIETLDGGRLRIRTRWYPAAIRVLRRQHLLGD